MHFLLVVSIRFEKKKKNKLKLRSQLKIQNVDSATKPPSTCNNFIGELKKGLQTPLSKNDWKNVESRITSVGQKYQKILTDQAVKNLNNEFNVIQTIFKLIKITAEQQRSYTQEFPKAKTNLTQELNKSWFNLYAKIIADISDKNTSDSNFTVLFEKMIQECATMQNATDLAVQWARTFVSNTIFDSINLISQPLPLEDVLLARMKQLTRNRQFESLSPEVERLLTTRIKSAATQMESVLKSFSTLVLSRINNGNYNTTERINMTVGVKKAVLAFSPNNTLNDVRDVLEPFRKEFNDDLNVMRNLSAQELQETAEIYLQKYAERADQGYAYLYGESFDGLLDVMEKILVN